VGSGDGVCGQRVHVAVKVLWVKSAGENRDSNAGGQCGRKLVSRVDLQLPEDVREMTLHRSGSDVSDRVENYQFHPQWATLLDQLWVE
jgi:hypothetical protein